MIIYKIRLNTIELNFIKYLIIENISIYIFSLSIIIKILIVNTSKLVIA